MKTHKLVFSVLFTMASVFTLHAQKDSSALPKKETIAVWGECGMCKNKIEKAATTAGATTASWDEDSKQLAVTYYAGKTNSLKIQQGIAAAGYDTKDVNATKAAYEKLPGCCHYERRSSISLA